MKIKTPLSRGLFYSITGCICRPAKADIIVSPTRSKSHTSECGLPFGSSCAIGTVMKIINSARIFRAEFLYLFGFYIISVNHSAVKSYLAADFFNVGVFERLLV